MRWLKFNTVGAMGMAVQLGSLGLFVHVLGLHYLLATALAVEMAVLHNFIWHRRWTWADRQGISVPAWGVVLLRFNLTTGMISIVGNLISMRVLAGAAGLEPIVANLLSIILCSLVNFLVCDYFVFLTRADQEGSPEGETAPRG